jgi:hypothetical protein
MLDSRNCKKIGQHNYEFTHLDFYKCVADSFEINVGFSPDEEKN